LNAMPISLNYFPTSTIIIKNEIECPTKADNAAQKN